MVAFNGLSGNTPWCLFFSYGVLAQPETHTANNAEYRPALNPTLTVKSAVFFKVALRPLLGHIFSFFPKNVVNNFHLKQEFT